MVNQFTIKIEGNEQQIMENLINIANQYNRNEAKFYLLIYALNVKMHVDKYSYYNQLLN